jgi:hypothetical protein
VIRERADGGYWDGTGLLLLWCALLAGPFGWTINQGVGYAVMKPVCAGAATHVLWSIALVALVITAAGVWLGWRCLRQLRAATEDGGRPADRSYFLAIVGMSFNVLIALLIVTSLVPQFLLSPCE